VLLKDIYITGNSDQSLCIIPYRWFCIIHNNLIIHFYCIHKAAKTTDSTDQNLWEVNSCSDSQEISCPVWNPKFHYWFHKNLPLISIWRQMKPVHIITLYFFLKINFNIIHLCLSLVIILFPSGFLIKGMVLLLHWNCATAIQWLLHAVTCQLKWVLLKWFISYVLVIRKFDFHSIMSDKYLLVLRKMNLVEHVSYNKCFKDELCEEENGLRSKYSRSVRYCNVFLFFSV
jgi:hypothetical protein